MDVEGLGIVFLEASAVGLAVVAGDSGGAPDAVQDGQTGFVVPVGDVGALTARLRELRDDSSLRARLGDEGRRRMRVDFSVERMVDDVQRVYDEATAR